MLRMVGILAVLLASAIPACAAGNAEAGRKLVMQSCTACHASAGSASATDAAPSFSFIARDHKESRAWVRGWLMNPHPPMRGIVLSRQQVDDIIAYLDTLPAS